MQSLPGPARAGTPCRQDARTPTPPASPVPRQPKPGTRAPVRSRSPGPKRRNGASSPAPTPQPGSNESSYRPPHPPNWPLPRVRTAYGAKPVRRRCYSNPANCRRHSRTEAWHWGRRRRRRTKWHCWDVAGAAASVPWSARGRSRWQESLCRRLVWTRRDPTRVPCSAERHVQSFRPSPASWKKTPLFPARP